MKRIRLASGSALKLRAAQRGTTAAGLTATEVVGTKVDIGEVPAQPEGRDQTRELALDRLGELDCETEAVPAIIDATDEWLLAIESGIVNERGGWHDLAYVVLMDEEGNEYQRISAPLEFPTELVEEARKRGFKTTTVGQVIAERRGGAHDDPHSALSNGAVTREALLADAIEGVIRDALEARAEKAAEQPAGETYDVAIGGYTYSLPLVDSGKGFKYALFNPLGNSEVNEEAGYILAGMMPDDVDVLIMPDGKAQALLHVISREAQLPSVVVRKEQKPYANKVLSATVPGTVTTGKPQKLYLDGTDAKKLRGKSVVIVDDVVSTGKTLEAVRQLIEEAGGSYVCTMAVFTEGGERADVIALGDLPLIPTEPK